MSRLIDADTLLRDIEHYHLSDGKFQHWVEIQPTIEERKKGKWIERGKSGDEYCIECSECGEQFTTRNTFDLWESEYLFCHRCGADMRGKG